MSPAASESAGGGPAASESAGGGPAASESAGGGHLDDEAISAALDGEATGAEAAHLGRCPSCRARRAALAGAAQAVSTAAVSAPAPEAAAAAVARAMAEGLAGAEWGGLRGAGAAPEDPILGPAAAGRVVEQGPAPAGDASGAPAATGEAPEPVPLALWRRGARSPAVAAAVIAVLLAGAGLLVAGLHHGSTTSAARGSAHPAAMGPARVSAPGGSPVNGSPAPGAARAPTSNMAPPVLVPNPAPLPEFGSFGGPAALERALRTRLPSYAAVTPAVAPTATPVPGGPVANPAAGAASLSPCAAALAAGAGQPQTARPVLAGLLTYQARPAELAVYATGTRRTAVVADTAGCRVVAIVHP